MAGQILGQRRGRRSTTRVCISGTAAPPWGFEGVRSGASTPPASTTRGMPPAAVTVRRDVVSNFLLEDEIDDIEAGMLVGLDVSNRHIGACSDAMAELGRCLQALPLDALDLSSNLVTTSALGACCSNIDSIDSLGMLDVGYNPLDAAGVAYLGAILWKFPVLRYLALPGTRMHDHGMQVLARLLPHTTPGLLSLVVGDNQLTAACLADIVLLLATHPALGDLDVRQNAFGDGDTAPLWAGLARDTRCRCLSLAHCALGPAHGTAIGTMLRANRGLESLDLDGNALCFPGALAVLEACATEGRLVSLSLRRNLVCDDDVAELGHHNSLDEVKTRTPPPGASPLCELKLCKNMLSLHEHSSMTRVLRHFPRLQTFEIRACLLGEWSVAGLSTVLDACPRLRVFRAGRNILGFRGLARFLARVRTHPALLILEVQKNFNSFEEAPAARLELVKLLRTSPRLEILHMHGNLLFGDATRAEALAVADALYRRCVSALCFTWTGTRLFEFLRVRGVLGLYGLPDDAGTLSNLDIFALFRADFVRRVAFVMALHPRLGACSPARWCDPLVVSLILASPLCPARPPSFVWDVSPSTSSDESE